MIYYTKDGKALWQNICKKEEKVCLVICSMWLTFSDTSNLFIRTLLSKFGWNTVANIE